MDLGRSRIPMNLAESGWEHQEKRMVCLDQHPVPAMSLGRLCLLVYNPVYLGHRDTNLEHPLNIF